MSSSSMAAPTIPTAIPTTRTTIVTKTTTTKSTASRITNTTEPPLCDPLRFPPAKCDQGRHFRAQNLPLDEKEDDNVKGKANEDVIYEDEIQKWYHRNLPNDARTLCYTCCSIIPAQDYNSHYQQHHAHRCVECNIVCLTEQWLALHITERHDVLTLIRRQRGEAIFRCIVESCPLFFLSRTDRRKHLLQTHKFPHHFRFDQGRSHQKRGSKVTNYGNNGKKPNELKSNQKKSRERKQHDDKSIVEDIDDSTMKDSEPTSTVKTSEKPALKSNPYFQNDGDVMQDDVDSLTKGLSKIRFAPKKVPTIIHFGRR